MGRACNPTHMNLQKPPYQKHTVVYSTPKSLYYGLFPHLFIIYWFSTILITLILITILITPILIALIKCCVCL